MVAKPCACAARISAFWLTASFADDPSPRHAVVSNDTTSTAAREPRLATLISMYRRPSRYVEVYYERSSVAVTSTPAVIVWSTTQ
jgi:hypothetical protein